MKRTPSETEYTWHPGIGYMTHTPIRLFLILAFFTTLFTAVLPSGNVHALAGPFDTTTLPSLDQFIAQVRNGQAGVIRGVYIPGILAAPVIQQPGGRDDFVSPWQNVITQFGLASRMGSTGLLAHNYLAGEAFELLQAGQEIDLIEGSGVVSRFTVREILRYKALQSDSTATSFLDPESGKTIASADLFTRVYSQPGQVVFQTCIQANGDPSWGRLFVIAVPVD
jgi:hypothetical protein